MRMPKKWALQCNAPTTRNARNERGSIAEIPVVLWVMICLLVFPLLDMCAVGLRTAEVGMAAQRACMMAARANSFETAINGGVPAVDVAKGEVANLAKSYGGVRITNVSTMILATKADTKVVQTYTGPLPKPANTADYIYQIRVAVSAEVDPLVQIPYLPLKVSGLNEPMKINCMDQQYAECPQGLNI